jgi:uncharacterized protein involved in exopolysaccharide biosynthesis
MAEANYPMDPNEDFEDENVALGELLAPVRRRWKLVAIVAIVGGALAFGIGCVVPQKFTAAAVFLPPQHQQSAAASALASLSALSGLGGGAQGRESADQYIGLMQSTTVSDRILKRFDLVRRWDEKYIEDARKHLQRVVQISVGKKDGLIRIEVTDESPATAANMANQYVEELRTLTNSLAVTEAQQRRVFFEHLLEETRDRLSKAQVALEASGYTSGALNTEPKSAGETYARLRAELTSAQIRLQVIRSTLADSSTDVIRQQETVDALSSQVSKLEAADEAHPHSSDYVNRYREFKYQETLFDLFARQYETARVDESREGALIQVVDPALPPQRHSFPKRSLFTLVGLILGAAAASSYVIVRARHAARED